MAQKYKKGDKIHPKKTSGGEGWLLQVEEATEKTLKVKLIYPSTHNKNFLAGSTKNMTASKNASKNLKIISITETRKVFLQSTNPSGGEPVKEWIKPWSWFGNKASATKMTYGGSNSISAGSTAGPASAGTTVTKLQYSGRLTSEWEYVPGTYKWGNKLGDENWNGWKYCKGCYRDSRINDYKRPITYQVKSKKKKERTDWAEFDVTFVPYKAPIPEPKPEPIEAPEVELLDGYNEKTSISGYYERDSDVKVVWEQEKGVSYEIKATYNGKSIPMSYGTVLSEYGTYKINITATNNKNTSKKDSDSSTVVIQDTREPELVVFDKNAGDEQIGPDPEEYISSSSVKPTWIQDNTAFSYSVSSGTFTDIDGNMSSKSIMNGTNLTEYGIYTFSVTAENKNNPSISITYDCTIIIEDPTPPPDFNIFDMKDGTVYTTNSIPVFLTARYPTINLPDRCELFEVDLNYQPHMLGSAVTDNGIYSIRVSIMKKTNNMILTKEGYFEIDDVPPEPPVIDIYNGIKYKGEDYGLVTKLPTNINYKVFSEQSAEGIVVSDLKIFYKPQLYANWQPYSPATGNGTFITKGVYKITARCFKPKNGLYSETSTTLQVYRKIKHNWLITLDKNEPTYRTIATVNIIPDPFLKYMYKLNNGDWQWYREPIKIYENGTMYFKSLDGDDDYESEVAFKIIDIIDTQPPTKAVIGGVTEGGVYSTPVIPYIIP